MKSINLRAAAMAMALLFLCRGAAGAETISCKYEKSFT